MLGFRKFLNTMPGSMNPRFDLAKVPLCLLIGCSTVFGYILADPIISLRTIFTGFGIFILATGAATLNSWQEYRLDGQFERTKNRPLPKGLLTSQQAKKQGLLLLFVGMVILFAVIKTTLPLLVAGCAVIFYNGIYTPLKRLTVLAIVPGALCGALPPYIGWLGGGGAAFSYTAALILALFILWQVPHYWLVLLSFKEDYERSPLPSLLKQFRETSLKRFLVTWVSALVFVMLLFLTLPVPLGCCFQLLIIVNGCQLLVVFCYGLAIRKNSNYRFLFIMLNIGLFLHMLMLAAGRALS